MVTVERGRALRLEVEAEEAVVMEEAEGEEEMMTRSDAWCTGGWETRF